MPNASAASVAAISPALLKQSPFVASKLGTPATVVGLMVTAGEGDPLAMRDAFANSTSENVPPELLDHKFPIESNASSQGDCTESAPLSLNVTSGTRSGVSIPLVGGVGK